MRVLLVDDNPDDRALVERELRKEWPEVEIVEANDIAGLQEALTGSPVDVLITDFSLNFTDGLDVLRRARASYPDCVAVMFTGTGNEEIAVEAMKAGLDDYVLKHHIERLVPAVRGLLEHRATRRQAAEAEHRFRSLFDNSPIGIFGADAAGVVLDANPALLQTFGVRDVDELNAVYAGGIYVDPVDAERWRRLADADLLRGFAFEMRLRGGAPIWVRLTGRALRGDDGEVIGYEVAAEDITNEHQLVQSLTESEGRFRALADAASIFIWVSDADNENVFCNRGWLEFRGRTLDQELDRGWVEGVHPDDLDPYLAEFDRCLALRVEYSADYRLRHHSGVYRHVVEHGIPRFGADGAFLGYVGTAVDITDRLDAERKLVHATSLLDSALDGAPVGIGWVDSDLRYVRVNEALARYNGLTPKAMIGRSVQEVLGPGLADAAVAAYRRVLETGESVTQVELTRETPEGTRWVVASFYPVETDGEVTGAGVAFVDVTETRQLQGRLFEAQKLEAIGLFAAGVTHDFNNILTTIDGYAALLESELSGHPRQARVAEIRAGARRGADLVRRLMGFVAQAPVEDVPVDAAAVAAATVSMLRPVLPTGLDVRITMVGEPAWVRAGEGQLVQVLMNFVFNAADALPGGGVITVTVEASESTVEIRVEDDGIGISPEVLPLIWEPRFTTKPGSTEATLGGSGLGLSSVRGIVEQLGGTVDVRSVVGEGSTFFVRLPRLPADEAGDAAAGGELVSAPRGSASVLVAEDEELLRQLYRTVLEQAGYDVVTSKDGREALGLAGGADLVIADAEMPGLGGAELRRLLAAQGVHVPVLLVSGHDVEQIDGADAASFLQKPFTPAALTAKVRELLGG